jgi:hypothetical protein
MAVTDKPGNPITFHSADDIMNLILRVRFASKFRKPKMIFKQNRKKCFVWKCIFKKLRFKNVNNSMFSNPSKKVHFKKHMPNCDVKGQTTIFQMLNYDFKNHVFKSHILKLLFLNCMF